jgi:hypothetical protein
MEQPRRFKIARHPVTGQQMVFPPDYVFGADEPPTDVIRVVDESELDRVKWTCQNTFNQWQSAKQDFERLCEIGRHIIECDQDEDPIGMAHSLIDLKCFLAPVDIKVSL